MKFDYSWEVVNKFNWKFLPMAFPKTFLHKFAKEGEYHLIHIKDTYYDIQVSESKTMPEDNGVYTSDVYKNKIYDNIIKNFNSNAVYTMNSGILYFNYQDWFFKIKIVKKLKNFNPDEIHCI